MNEDDIAHTYSQSDLREVIEGIKKERDFWFKMMNQNKDDVYFVTQYSRYSERLRDLRNLLKGRFGLD